MHWIEEAGLILDIIGALVLASGLIMNQTRALQLGTGLYARETDEDNLKLRRCAERLELARKAKIGVTFLVLGFLGQAIGNWPT